jgi:hypothetical protein
VTGTKLARLKRLKDWCFATQFGACHRFSCHPFEFRGQKLASPESLHTEVSREHIGHLPEVPFRIASSQQVATSPKSTVDWVSQFRQVCGMRSLSLCCPRSRKPDESINPLTDVIVSVTVEREHSLNTLKVQFGNPRLGKV